MRTRSFNTHKTNALEGERMRERGEGERVKKDKDTYMYNGGGVLLKD